MRYFQSFLILVVSALMLMLPVPDAIKDFATTSHVNIINSTTLPAATSDNITFSDTLYQQNTAYISVNSTLSTDTPNIASYNSTIRQLTVNGLAENNTRVLTATYSVYSLGLGSAIEKLVGLLPFFWLILVFAFMVIGVIVIFI